MTGADKPRHLRAIAGTPDPEYASITEPLQDAESIILRGVLSNAMTNREVSDAADIVLDMKPAGDNDRSKDFVFARSVLLVSDIITDLDLLDASPTILGTTRGAMAHVITSSHMTALREAFEIEELPMNSTNSKAIFAYRTEANATLEKHKRTNAVRILAEITRRVTVPDDSFDVDVARRAVGYVISRQLKRRDAALSKIKR